MQVWSRRHPERYNKNINIKALAFKSSVVMTNRVLFLYKDVCQSRKHLKVLDFEQNGFPGKTSKMCLSMQLPHRRTNYHW